MRRPTALAVTIWALSVATGSVSGQTAATYNEQGAAWYDRGRYDQAIANFNEAIRLDPNYDYAYHNRGQAWSASGRDDLALADFNRAIQINPSVAEPYVDRGRVLSNLGSYERAVADLDQALRLKPSYALANVVRGMVREKQGLYDRALADYTEALRLSPSDAGTYNRRAWLRATCPDPACRDGKRAYEDAVRACRLNGYRSGGDLDTLAAAYAECGDFAHAVEYQHKAQALLTDEKERQAGLARLKLYSNKQPYREPTKPGARPAADAPPPTPSDPPGRTEADGQKKG